ncbi:MAG: 16S rRNA (cytosine(967)-C(5))-methyltransferase RsmB [Oscillospiraceae bacterium]|jgi:16S rRNA (cytosine967-C5)-methyltransferase|nr:16S rRNA (cytosine(967)-C(5))-methyltransferase RsmB [Oscillospiraceae bacterium]
MDKNAPKSKNSGKKATNKKPQTQTNAKPSPNPRRVAFDVLYNVLVQGGYSNIALGNAINGYSLQHRDAAFCAKIVYGVLENLLYLNAIIAKQSKIKIDKIDEKAKILLQMGMYQLIWMNVPASAAVNETVNLAQRLKLFAAKGFINGMLRSFAPQADLYANPAEAAPLLAKNSDEVHLVALAYSVQPQIVKMLFNSYGKAQTTAMLAQACGRPPLYLRVNTLKTTPQQLAKLLEEQGVRTSPVAFLSAGLVADNFGDVTQLQAFKDGLFHIQDAASQLCCDLLCLQPGENMLDVCAAPGGKSFTSAQKGGSTATVTACDLYPHKIELITEGANRLDLCNIKSFVCNAEENNPDFANKFDKILCDVPCSGLGVIRRKPEIKYKTDLLSNDLPTVQYKILQTAAAYLKTGGELVYSTCTLNPAENGEVCKKFLAEHTNFAPVLLALPQGVQRAIDEPENELTLLPHINNTDGFFAAKFVKKV